jgi:hypothetical protein
MCKKTHPSAKKKTNNKNKNKNKKSTKKSATIYLGHFLSQSLSQ